MLLALRGHRACLLLVMIMGGLAGCGSTPPATPAAPETEAPPPPPPTPPNVMAEIPEDIVFDDAIWPEPSHQTPPVMQPFTHKVRWPRETLYSIALWYTGSGRNWKRLAEANADIKPHRIRIGDTILIPEDLLKHRRPMPAKFLSTMSGKKKKAAPRVSKPAVKKPPAAPEAVELYGPVESDSASGGEPKGNLPVPLETLDE